MNYKAIFEIDQGYENFRSTYSKPIDAASALAAYRSAIMAARRMALERGALVRLISLRDDKGEVSQVSAIGHILAMRHVLQKQKSL